MSKLPSVLLCLCLAFALPCALAQAPSAHAAALGVPLELPGYGTLTPTSCARVDKLDYTYRDWSYVNILESGDEADYVLLRFNITNDTDGPVDYYSDIASVRVVCGDRLFAEGWGMQQNHDGRYPEVPSTEDTFAIPAGQKGYFVVACAVPNAALSGDDSPLKMAFAVGAHEIICDMRGALR